MKPTAAGLHLKRSAEPILGAMQEAERTVRSKAGMEKLTLRVATQCYTCYHWLPSVLQGYKKQCPGCDVSILLEATQNPMQALIEGSIDVAIVDQFHRKDRRVQVHQIFSDEVLAIASASHRWAKKRYVVPEDFSKERLIAHNCSPDHNVLLKRFLGPANVVPAETLQVPLTEAILELVKAGFGVTALSRWAVSSALEGDALCGVSIGRRGFPRNWSIAMLKSTSRLEHVRLFVELLSRSMQR
jgi:LysR family transcriptional regulator for metE and metH